MCAPSRMGMRYGIQHCITRLRYDTWHSCWRHYGVARSRNCLDRTIEDHLFSQQPRPAVSSPFHRGGCWSSAWPCLQTLPARAASTSGEVQDSAVAVWRLAPPLWSSTSGWCTRNAFRRVCATQPGRGVRTRALRCASSHRRAAHLLRRAIMI